MCEIQIKRKDVFSGTFPYKEYVSERSEICIDQNVNNSIFTDFDIFPKSFQKNQDRGYIVDVNGKKEVIIRFDIVTKLVDWNKNANVALIDVKFIRTWMVVCIGKANIKNNLFHSTTIEFI